MKSFTKFMSAAVLAAATMSLSGCQDEDFGYKAAEIAYNKNFIKAFEKIDPLQDWNLATRASVTVTTSGNDEVKVYAKTDGTYRIVADYTNVSGTKELGFDMLENVTELLVTNGAQTFFAKPGDNVSFGATTRSVYTETKDGINKAGVSVGDYVEFDADKYVGAVTKAGTGILPEEEANLHKVVQDFSYISNGPFELHPIYWNTSSTHILGVYWKEGSTYHYQDVYRAMDAEAAELATRTITYSGQCSHFWKEPTVGMTCTNGHKISEITTDSEGSHFWYNTTTPCYENATYGCVEGFMCPTHGKVTHTVAGSDGRYHDAMAECTCGLDKFSEIEYHVGDVCPTCGEILHMEYGHRYTIENKNYTGIGGTAPISGMIYSKGITVDLPVGTQFGFYLKVYTSGTYYHTLYSQGELNKVMKGDFFDKVNYPTQTVANACKVVKNNGKNTEDTYSWAATFQTKIDDQDVQYLCFEDWSVNLTDLNDLVFATPITPTSTPPSIVNDEAQTWVICAEDLGNTFDLDYNDVVVEVGHVSGQPKATITPIAAGGTLASYIFFNNGSEDKCLGEIHELLGQSNTASGDYTPFNVDGTVNTSYCKNYEFVVANDWSVASSTVGDASFDSSNAANMGGFYVKVVPAGKESTQGNATVSGQKIQNSFTSGSDNVPYVFCVPRDWERIEGTTKKSSWFRWSNELIPMSTLSGYDKQSYNEEGHSFAEWVADHNVATDWYKYPNLGTTTGIKGITETPVSVVSGDSGEGNEGTGEGGDSGNTGGNDSSSPTELTLTSIESLGWSEAGHYSVTGSLSDLKEGAKITFTFAASNGYADLSTLQTGNTTNIGQHKVGTTSPNTWTLSSDDVSNLQPSENDATTFVFYVVAWDAVVTKVTIE